MTGAGRSVPASRGSSAVAAGAAAVGALGWIAGAGAVGPGAGLALVAAGVGTLWWVAGRGRGAEAVPPDAGASAADRAPDTETALRESEAIYRTSFEVANVGKAQLEPRTGRFLRVNRRLCEMTGYSSDALLERTVADVTHPDDRAAHRAALARLAAGETADYVAELRYLHRDGGVRWVLVSAALVHDLRDRPLHTHAVIQDITDRKRAEARLREREGLLRAVTDGTADLILVKDRDGRVLMANPAACRAFARDASAVVGAPIEALVAHAASAAQIRAADRRVLADGEPQTVEQELALPVGARTFLATNAPYRSEAGEVVGVVTISTDVTERVQAAREREALLAATERARRQAEAANREKDEFLAVLSHELRTPLSAILSWTHLARRGLLAEAQQARALETIERNARLQAQLVGDLLDVSRIVSGRLTIEREAVEFGEIVRSSVESVRVAAAAKGVQLVDRESPLPAPLVGDARRLAQVVTNLLTNAIKFTPEGGRVDVALEAMDGRAVLTVRDTGEGIAPAFLPHVFSRFRQAEAATVRHHGGLGLGLAIVRHLVDLHGGTVEAASDGPGRGATFVVTLPLGDAEPLAVPSRPVDPPRPTLHGVHVLLVEDDSDTREALQLLLEEAGAAVTPAASVAEALAAFDEHRPTVLVSDISMPGEDGYALVRAVRRRDASAGHRTPAIAVTGLASQNDAETARRAGFDAHLAKPIDPAILTRLVTNFAELTPSHH